MSLSVTSAVSPIDFEGLHWLQNDFRKHFEGRDVFKVLALVDALRLDARTAGGRQLFLGHRLGVAGLQQLADHFTVNLAAELLADHLERRLARAKPVQARGTADALQTRRDLLTHALGRHLHLHAALQFADTLHGNLHDCPFLFSED